MAPKRTHPSPQIFEVPELPKLSGGTLLQVFTHKSLRRAPDVEPFDNERFSLLGQRVLDVLVTDVLLSQRPMLSVSEVTTQKTFFSFEIMPLLVRHYGLLDHVRCHPD
ncbi:hypothetical protein B0H14DRAFT_2672543, partial [Mycena olivaceomarginata]